MLENIFKTEQQRGIFGYLASAFFANLINIALSKYTTLSVQQTTFIAVYLIGNTILYSSDILFAKERFYLDSYKGQSPFIGTVAYTDITTRLKWLMESFYNKYFFRFLITVILDTIIGLNLLRYTIYKLDEYQLFKTWKYRNFVVATIVSAFTYFLYLSTLRFKWAYNHEDNIILNILVMIWLSLAILITAKDNINNKEKVSWRMLYKS